MLHYSLCVVVLYSRARECRWGYNQGVATTDKYKCWLSASSYRVSSYQDISVIFDRQMCLPMTPRLGPVQLLQSWYITMDVPSKSLNCLVLKVIGKWSRLGQERERRLYSVFTLCIMSHEVWPHSTMEHSPFPPLSIISSIKTWSACLIISTPHYSKIPWYALLSLHFIGIACLGGGRIWLIIEMLKYQLYKIWILMPNLHKYWVYDHVQLIYLLQ